MNKLFTTMESIVYNRVGLKEFLDRGAFVGYPGIKVSRGGKMYLTQDNRSAPLMLDTDEGDIIIRGSYLKRQGEGYRLLTVLPEVFNSSAEKLFQRWCSGRGIQVSEFKLLTQPSGKTYINYPHDLEVMTFPVQASAFGIIPMFYALDEQKIAGIAYRVCPTHVLHVTPTEVTGLEYLPDAAGEDTFVAESVVPDEPLKRKRTDILVPVRSTKKK
jgi:hypothetical protein